MINTKDEEDSKFVSVYNYEPKNCGLMVPKGLKAIKVLHGVS